MNGILLLNKPTGISSFKAIRKAQAILNFKKVGHCGTLDPLATGMLPIMINEATKYSQYIISSDKAYTVELKLGYISDTYDVEGDFKQVTNNTSFDVSKIELTLKSFTGNQFQMPPKFSALKVNGKRAYDLARNGISFDLQKRSIHISKIDLISYSNEYVKLYVECSKGTYIRSLVHDIGQTLGCGAIMTSLNRNWVSPFEKATMYHLDSLEACKLIPVDTIFNDGIFLDEQKSKAISFGQCVNVSQLTEKANVETIAIYSFKKAFMGVGTIKENILKPKRLLGNLQD